VQRGNGEFIVLRWVEGISPKKMSSESIQAIAKLFLTETKETYSEASIRGIPVSEWKGSLVLIDEQNRIKGVLWTTTLAKKTCRIVAFVISNEFQRKGIGTIGWDLVIQNARNHGLSYVQLEVKADNLQAINFYRGRGLEVVEDLVGYYSTGLGHMMRGPI